jgi:hypothetical protein
MIDVKRVNDPIDPGTNQRGGGSQAGAERHRVSLSPMQDEVSLPVEPPERYCSMVFNNVEHAVRICQQFDHPCRRRPV